MAEHATQAYIGHLTQLQRSNGDSPETFTTIHEVVEMNTPEELADEIEVSHFESPGARKEYIRGFIESGEVPFKVNWNPSAYADHAAIRDDHAATDGGRRNWRIILPNAVETITFTAYVKGLKFGLDPKAQVTADVTLKASGAQTVT